MANTITAQTLHDGPRNLVIKTHIDSTASPVELADVILVNVSDFVDSVGATLARVKIMKIEAALGAWSVELLWDATTNVPIVSIPTDPLGTFVRDWTDIGGIINDAGSGITGDILWTSTGLGANELGHITLYMKKQ